MVDMDSDEREQIPEAALYVFDPSGELGQPCRKVREPLRLELTVHHDTAALAEHSTPRRDELVPGIGRICRKEFVVLGRRAGLSLHVHRILKWNVPVGAHARKSWDRRV